MMKKVMLWPILNQAPSAHFVKPSTAKEEKKYYALLFSSALHTLEAFAYLLWNLREYLVSIYELFRARFESTSDMHLRA